MVRKTSKACFWLSASGSSGRLHPMEKQESCVSSLSSGSLVTLFFLLKIHSERTTAYSVFKWIDLAASAVSQYWNWAHSFSIPRKRTGRFPVRRASLPGFARAHGVSVCGQLWWCSLRRVKDLRENLMESCERHDSPSTYREAHSLQLQGLGLQNQILRIWQSEDWKLFGLV